VIGPADDARSLALPANDAETVLEPTVWLTLVIEQVAVPLELVVPVQLCAAPPLPSVNDTETPTTGLPPEVCVSTAERLLALPFVSVVGPL
jgi:hypothetical protein